MNLIIQRLRDWGCDTEEALSRMCENEDMYVERLYDLQDNDEIYELGCALKENEVIRAFDIADEFKDTLYELGITPMYDQLILILEPLRSGNVVDLEEEYDDLIRLKEKFDTMMEE